jgi:hypothetical protein
MEEISLLEKMAMVESQELADRGLATGLISNFDPDLKKENYVVLGNNIHRICSPTDDSPYPLIFYTKDSSVDGAPTAENIVSLYFIFYFIVHDKFAVWINNIQLF